MTDMQTNHIPQDILDSARLTVPEEHLVDLTFFTNCSEYCISLKQY
jgi:hypothetical protein